MNPESDIQDNILYFYIYYKNGMNLITMNISLFQEKYQAKNFKQ